MTVLKKPPRSIGQLRRECLLAVHNARESSLPYKGWQQLLVRNMEGSVIGAQPYTIEALSTFREAYRVDPENVHLLQHLAIATHAQAWDLELAGDSRAATAWRQAFEYWREISTSTKLWDELKEKYLLIDPDGDPTFLDVTRRHLLEDLLDIHVEFVRHWMETGCDDQCKVHLDIIRSARLAPAVKKQFAGKVFTILTAGVQDALQDKAYLSALTSLEKSLSLFPGYLPALHDMAKVSLSWLSILSYLEQWPAILELSERIYPWMEKLANHPEIRLDPLASAKLEDLATEFCQRGYFRGIKYGTAEAGSLLSSQEIEEACVSYRLSIRWGRLAQKISKSGSELLSYLSLCLNNLAAVLWEEVIDVFSTPDSQTKYRVVVRICRENIVYVEEAVAIEGEKDLYVKNLGVFRGTLEQAEMWLSLKPSMDSWNEDDEQDQDDDDDDGQYESNEFDLFEDNDES